MTPREAAFFVMQAIIDRGRTYAVFLTDDGRTQIMPTDGQKYSRVRDDDGHTTRQMVGIYDFGAQMADIESDLEFAWEERRRAA